MAYNLEITERAEDQLDELIHYLIFGLKNESAAKHLLDCVSVAYERISENPYQFPLCRDENLAECEYREAVLSEMNYLVIFKISGNVVYIIGVFHEMENYCWKLIFKEYE